MLEEGRIWRSGLVGGDSWLSRLACRLLRGMRRLRREERVGGRPLISEAGWRGQFGWRKGKVRYRCCPYSKKCIYQDARVFGVIALDEVIDHLPIFNLKVGTINLGAMVQLTFSTP